MWNRCSVRQTAKENRDASVWAGARIVAGKTRPAGTQPTVNTGMGKNQREGGREGVKERAREGEVTLYLCFTIT